MSSILGLFRSRSGAAENDGVAGFGWQARSDDWCDGEVQRYKIGRNVPISTAEEGGLFFIRTLNLEILDNDLARSSCEGFSFGGLSGQHNIYMEAASLKHINMLACFF